MTVFLQATCDEAGTDHNHDYVIAAGCVGFNRDWLPIESAWDKEINHQRIPWFHARDFNRKERHYTGWSDTRLKKHYNALSKVVDTNPIYHVVVAVHKDSHKHVKSEIHGMKKMNAKSDYSLAFIGFVLHICDRVYAGLKDAKINFFVEDGPYSSGIKETYSELRKDKIFSELFGGLTITKKEDKKRGVEIADFIADKNLNAIGRGDFIQSESDTQLSIVMGPDYMLDMQNQLKEIKKKREEYKKITQR